MLFRSVENDIVAERRCLQTVSALQNMGRGSRARCRTRRSMPPSPVRHSDVRLKAKVHTRVGLRLNYEQSGIASLFKKTARKAKRWDLEADAPVQG